jgi:hypothetical protein
MSITEGKKRKSEVEVKVEEGKQTTDDRRQTTETKGDSQS